MTVELQTAIIIIVNIIANVGVGIILSRQIKSQKEVIKIYKDLLRASSPDDIITLHDREVAKIKQTMGLDIAELKTQIMELGTFADKVLKTHEEQMKLIGQSKRFSRSAIININMPNCAGVLAEISQYTNSDNP